MPQQQIVGLALFAVALADTALGHLVIVPRVANPQKRMVLRVAFAISGVCIAGFALAVYKGMLRFG